MNTREMTLDELLKETQEKEAAIREPEAVTSQIKQMCAVLKDAVEKFSGDDRAIRILTDYDADGICSAMIMKRTLECMNPDITVDVVCNDRRGSYGVPKDITGAAEVQDIILDMGSNELGYIQAELGGDSKAGAPIVIDHHLIEHEEDRKQFIENPRYLNPHCMTEADGKSAEYCATGLAYRCFQELANDGAFTIPYDEKIDRTVAIYAAIGTVADVVDLMDMHGYNRDIVKQGIQFIDTANPDNTDYILGAALEAVGISEKTNAKELAYNMGAYLNAASRMSDVTRSNGAQEIFDMLSANPVTDLGREPTSQIDFAIEDFKALNELKKAVVQCIMDSPDFKAWEAAEQQKDTGIAVFIIPEEGRLTGKDGLPLTWKGDEIPYAAAINGLIAGRVEDSLDKAVIILSKKGDEYVGSGRAPEGYDSLNAFMQTAVQEAGLQEIMKFGGHEAAIGISSIPEEQLGKFQRTVEQLAGSYQRSMTAMPVIRLTENEIVNPDLLLQKLQALEPIGQGCKLPPVMIEGTVEKVSSISRKYDNPKWQNISVKTEAKNDKKRPVSLRVKDWNYPTYPSAEKQKTVLLADMEVSSFRGQSVEFTVRQNAEFAREHTQELEKPKPVRQAAR